MNGTQAAFVRPESGGGDTPVRDTVLSVIHHDAREPSSRILSSMTPGDKWLWSPRQAHQPVDSLRSLAFGEVQVSTAAV
jgi:hypothetical protein